jgi:hypothetical protein
VETAQELARLLELKVEGAQGYFLGRPVPPTKLAAVIRRSSSARFVAVEDRYGPPSRKAPPRVSLKEL